MRNIHSSKSSESAKSRLKNIARRAMVEHALQPDFSGAALQELKAHSEAATEKDSSLRDLRKLLWCSIDNDDSRDLDQLSVAVPTPGRKVKILVAVADVDAMVKKGSALDQHARANTTSVYTAGGIFPMLPEELSTDLTSLGQDQERLAIVVEMEIDGDGSVGASEVYRAVVLNRAKLAYNSVAAWLDGKAPAPEPVTAVPGLDELLRLQDKTAAAMKELRHQHGALSLETTEARAVFDGEALTGLHVETKNRATELIEDFMIGANGVTARYLDKQGFPSVRRVLRSPERWERLVELATSLKEHLPGEPDGKALEAFLNHQREVNPTHFADISLSVVKLLGRGEYALELPKEKALGHFGLAVRDYNHSTAPNRRFPDVITQRLLKAALAKQPVPYETAELDELARHCTDAEDRATKVERQVRKSAAALLLESRIGEKFDAFVTGASEKGTWVRILQPPVEGRLVKHTDNLDVGDRLKVELVHTDVERGFVDFAWVKHS